MQDICIDDNEKAVAMAKAFGIDVSGCVDLPRNSREYCSMPKEQNPCLATCGLCTNNDKGSFVSLRACIDDNEKAVAMAQTFGIDASGCADLKQFCFMFPKEQNPCHATCNLCANNDKVVSSVSTDCIDDDAKAVAMAKAVGIDASGCVDLKQYCSIFPKEHNPCHVTCGLCAHNDKGM